MDYQGRTAVIQVPTITHISPKDIKKSENEVSRIYLNMSKHDNKPITIAISHDHKWIKIENHSNNH